VKEIQEACALVEVADTATLESLFTLAHGQAAELRRAQSARLKEENEQIDAYARLAHLCRMRLDRAAWARIGQPQPRGKWTADFVGELPREWLIPDSAKLRAYLDAHEGPDVPPAVPGIYFRRTT
jgi:hypothetical protein